MIAIGKRVYSLGVVAFGIVELAYGGSSSPWLPVPPHVVGYHILAYASVGLLIVAAVAANAPRTAAVGALALAGLFGLGLLDVHLPVVMAKPTIWVSWEEFAEAAAMALGGMLAFAQAPGVGEARAASVTRVARLAFGLCLLIFGGAHFAYAKFTASLVPAWLPPSQMFWTYATGGAQIAAGLATLSGIGARLAAILLTAMYATFWFLVQIPSIVSDPTSHNNWTENILTLIILGAAWTLADSTKADYRAAG